MDAIKENKEIILFWLPVHKGIAGNETADQIAKKAAISGFRPYFKIPYTDLFIEIKESLGKQFLEYLTETARKIGYLHYSSYQNKVSPYPWYYNKLLNRNDIVLINRIRSNHYNLNYSLYRKC